MVTDVTKHFSLVKYIKLDYDLRKIKIMFIDVVMYISIILSAFLSNESMITFSISWNLTNPHIKDQECLLIWG